MTDVNAQNAALRMTNTYSKPSVTYFTAMPNKLKLSARKLANLPGPECLHLREKWYNMPTKSTAGARIMSFLNPMNPMMMHLHELSKTNLMLIARSTKSKPKQLSSTRQTYNYRLKPKPNN
jgi:hypothetical protein